MESGVKKGQELSLKTVNDILSIIRNIIKFTVRKKIYAFCDPCAVQIKQVSYPLRVFNKNEQKQICKYILEKPEPCNIGILVCLFIGLRVGEFKKVLKSVEIEDTNFHTLRHTFATRCIGFDVKSLSKILGHATVNITMNHYVHPTLEIKKNMEKLFDLLASLWKFFCK